MRCRSQILSHQYPIYHFVVGIDFWCTQDTTMTVSPVTLGDEFRWLGDREQELTSFYCGSRIRNAESVVGK